jgi:hypothetical protein
MKPRFSNVPIVAKCVIGSTWNPGVAILKRAITFALAVMKMQWVRTCKKKSSQNKNNA